MKIVCDACQAKYSISDDKVQGKVFKIRCKKCSNIIVVRGGAGASEAPAPAPQEKDTRVYDYGYEGGDQAPAADDAVWHLVINQDQIGPMTVAEVEQRFAAGEVDGETFTWREGFADWLPLSQVDTFAGLVGGGATAGGGHGGQAAVAAMFGSPEGDMGSSRSDPGDLFAAASAGAAHPHAVDDGGGDLFGGKPAQAQAAANTKLRGERNENSVLFSLNNLAQLASDTPARSASPSSAPPMAGHATGAAGGEGSGLIDIRSMANAYLGGPGAAVGKPATSSAIGSIDDLPVFGGGGFSEPAVIVPTARAQNNNKLLYGLIAGVTVFAISAIILVIVLLRSTPKTQVVVADKADKPAAGSAALVPAADPAAGSAAAAAAVPAPAGSAAAPAPAGSAAQVAVADPSAAPIQHNPQPAHHDTTQHAAPTPPPTGGHPAATAVAMRDPKPPKQDAPAAAAKPDKGDTGGCDEVSCVLNNYEGACCAKFRKNKAGGGGGGGGGGDKPKSDLPDALDRSMISAGIANVKARVTSCGDKSPAKGQVKVHVKVGADGKVHEPVTVAATPDPALGACVAAAVQKASFAKTQGGGSFSFPFMF